MENPTVTGLRSRSRSKTPFLRSSCDRENCVEGEEHTHHKSGRKTPVKRSTPIKQLGQSSSKRTSETITEVLEEAPSPPARRPRRSARGAGDKLARAPDYSSEESLDRLKGHRKEIFQNEINSQYERVSTSSQRYTSLSDVTLSPIHTAHSLTHDRSRSRIGSPAYSACSTDSSFAEQALADTSLLLEINPDSQHLPSRLYKMAREYWNKYPKTDYTYSPLSRDRVELAPGQVAMPNMSRRSLSQFRVQGALTSAHELERLSAAGSWTSSTHKRFTSIDSSDDESQYVHKQLADERRWPARALAALASAAARAYRRVAGPSHRYPYTDRRPAKASASARAAAAATAPLRWLVVLLTTIVTTTVTTITTVTETVTETVWPRRGRAAAGAGGDKGAAPRRWWPWLLLLLPPLGYGWYCGHADGPLPPREGAQGELGVRLAALERWARGADARLLAAGQDLARLHDIDQHIELHSAQYLRDNLLRALTTADNAAALADELRKHLDRDYVTREQVDVISGEVEARAAAARAEGGAAEDTVRRVLQEYLGLFERRQLDAVREYLREHVHDHVRELHARGTSGVDEEAVRRVVAAMLDVYDADKTGLVDYALESAGGQVISTKCTELYQIKTKQYSILGLPVLWVYTSPRYALTPGAMPAECWAFQGFPGYLVLRTYAVVEVTGFSLEHMSRLLAVDGKIESAPKNFSVYGLHGEMDTEPHLFGDYMYDANGTAIQYFPVQHPKTTDIGGVQYPVAYDMIELRVESNHGNPTYTCVYRFRVHGRPLADVRRAAADSMRDSET